MNTISTNATLITGILCMTSLLSGQIIHAQSLTSSYTQTCGFDQHHKELLRNNPDMHENVDRFNEFVQTFNADELRGGGTLFVPVVVHVLETGLPITAISDDQIRDGIKWLNERYRKVPGTAGDGNGVDVNIEFALAVRDENGNCTNGITRYDMTGNATYMANGVYNEFSGISDAEVKSLDVWDQTQYYNIWLVSEIDNNNGGGGVQGYADFSSSHGQAYDGTVMLVNAYKNPTGITLAHELGHALNVYHTFEGDIDGTTCPMNTNCATNGDRVCDIPPHIRSNNDCDLSGTNACDGGSSVALFKNNYMDYSGDACQNMFTAGQNTRMQAALINQRASFLAVNGNMSLVPVGTPDMDISASKTVLCGTGQTVQFFDRSSCIPNTYLTDPGLPGITFAWTITNGNETHNPTSQNPVVTLNSPGVYNVTLAITTAQGTFTRNEQGMVVVANEPVVACVPSSSNTGNYAQTIYNVMFNTISSASNSGVNVAYTDLTCTQNTVVAANATYPLSISLRAGGSAAESMNAYIDYNNNGVFEDPSELVASGSQSMNSSGTITTDVTIPGTAVTNTLLRMRIYGEAGSLTENERNCNSTMFICDVEDYGLYISDALAAVTITASPGNTISYGTSVTFTPTPINGGGSPVYKWFRNATQVSTGSTYVANDLLPNEMIYCTMTSNLAGVISSPATSNSIIMEVTGPPRSEFAADNFIACAGSSITFNDLTTLAPTAWSWTFDGGSPASSTAQDPSITYSTPGTYAVSLVTSNSYGTGTTNTKTAYITILAVPANACSVTRTNTPAAGIGITRVQLNTIDKTTVYNDAVMNEYSCSDITPLTPNTQYSISVTVGNTNNQWVRVYIDHNNNGSFTDSGELIFAPPNGTGARSGVFTTPASPVLNTLLRMRVISDFTNTSPGPCTSPLQYGQVEDYGVIFSAPAGIQVAPKAFLNGPYDASTGIMGDGLRTASFIPTTEPFTAKGYSFIGGGGETIAPAVLSVSGTNAIVDWVIVELRSATDPATIVASKSALIQRDGDIVDLNGTSPLNFGLSAGNFYVALRHRNHLGVMTMDPIALNATPTTVDFTLAATNTYGTAARRSISGTFPVEVLWAGDVTFNGIVLYTGTGNDRDPILAKIGGVVPTNSISGYHSEDVNMDGLVIYTGSYNDRDIILYNIGGVVPTNSRIAQMP